MSVAPVDRCALISFVAWAMAASSAQLSKIEWLGPSSPSTPAR
jgi:hypothetical protein